MTKGPLRLLDWNHHSLTFLDVFFVRFKELFRIHDQFGVSVSGVQGWVLDVLFPVHEKRLYWFFAFLESSRFLVMFNSTVLTQVAR